MRLILTTALILSPLVAGADAAFAGSIVTIGGAMPAGPSIATIAGQRCETCAAPGAHSSSSSYRVPVLDPGTQKTEIIEINGEKRLARTEAWSGGSPVIFVSKLPASMAKGSSIADIHPGQGGSTESDIAVTVPVGDGVDTSATTSAVSADAATAEASANPAPPAAAPAPVEQAAAAPAPLAADGFDLRLSQLN